jgi:hypothetical protein
MVDRSSRKQHELHALLNLLPQPCRTVRTSIEGLARSPPINGDHLAHHRAQAAGSHDQARQLAQWAQGMEFMHSPQDVHKT